MRKVVLQEFVSADRLAAGPNDSVDFIPDSTRGDARFVREQVALMDTIDTLLLGRVTYGMFAGFWRSVTEGEEKEFGDEFNAVPKIVFSKTLKHAPTRLARGAVSLIYSPHALTKRVIDG